jgi:hypothetical protein
MTLTTGASSHLPDPAPDARWRLIDRLVVVVFCLGLVVPGLLLAAGRRSAEIENRPLLKLPAFAVAKLLDPAYYGGIDRFLTDNDPVRPYAVRLRGEAYWKLGGTGNPAVVKGRGDWLFTSDEIRPVCELSAQDVAAALDRAQTAFSAAGQTFRFVLAPDKHAIYPEVLDPSAPYPTPCTDLQRSSMAAALDARSAWAVEGWKALAAARAADGGGPPLYYTQDSHWTPTGALAAIGPLMASLGPNLWAETDVRLGRRKRVAMELARQIGLQRAETVAAPVVRPGVHLERSVVELPFRTTGARAVYRFVATGDRPLVPGVTVIVYDSFFGLNIPSVAPFFADSIWIHVGDLKNHPDIGRLIGPVDRVILERVERGLYQTRIDELLAPLVRAAG